MGKGSAKVAVLFPPLEEGVQLRLVFAVLKECRIRGYSAACVGEAQCERVVLDSAVADKS
jgi:hypothetical protein